MFSVIWTLAADCLILNSALFGSSAASVLEYGVIRTSEMAKAESPKHISLGNLVSRYGLISDIW